MRVNIGKPDYVRRGFFLLTIVHVVEISVEVTERERDAIRTLKVHNEPLIMVRHLQMDIDHPIWRHFLDAPEIELRIKDFMKGVEWKFATLAEARAFRKKAIDALKDFSEMIGSRDNFELVTMEL